MSETDERLVRMANDIARNFAVLGEGEAVAATAEHIALFWDPRMKARGVALLHGGGAYSTIAQAALARVAQHGDEAHHSPAD